MAYSKSKKHSLLSILAFNIFGILLTASLSQCGGDDDPVTVCSPASVLMYAGSDSIVYVYDGDNRLAEIQRLTRGVVEERYVMTHADGKLTGCSHQFPQVGLPDYVTENFVFTYGSNGKPAIRGLATGGSSLVETVAYSYDEKNHLTRRVTQINGTPIMSTRYEYSGDNVSKIYYVQSTGEDETPGAELLTFDDHKRFFAGSADLTLVETYIFDYEPSVNNVMSMKLYAVPGSNYAVPYVYTYQMGYNEQGYVKSISGTPYPVFTFSKMTYTCR